MRSLQSSIPVIPHECFVMHRDMLTCRGKQGIMGKGTLMLLLLLGAAAVSSRQVGVVHQPVESHVVPLNKPSKLEMDKRFETVSGDPAKGRRSFCDSYSRRSRIYHHAAHAFR